MTSAPSPAPRAPLQPDEPITPELVLVAAPEEAKLARERLPQHPWLLAHASVDPAREVAPVVAVARPSPAPSRAAPAAMRRPPPRPAARAQRPRWRARFLVVGVAAVGALGALVLALEAYTPRRETAETTASRATSPAAPAPPATTTPVVTVRRPVRGARSRLASSLPTLRWKPAQPRDSYWVVLSRVSGVRATVVLTFVTKDPYLPLPRSWRNAGRRQTLAPGRYRWRTWVLRPGVTAVPSGAPLARGSFAVRRR